jgi:hypothetical protein
MESKWSSSGSEASEEVKGVSPEFDLSAELPHAQEPQSQESDDVSVDMDDVGQILE